MLFQQLQVNHRVREVSVRECEDLCCHVFGNTAGSFIRVEQTEDLRGGGMGLRRELKEKGKGTGRKRKRKVTSLYN